MSENSQHFYDRLSGQYDEMTRFKSRIDHSTEILRSWVKKYHIKTAIDVGCGTGLYSLALCRLGVQVYGVDNNASMLARAKEHSEQLQCPIEWHQLDMLELDRFHDKVDAVFCLGNTLPHILREEQLTQSFKAMQSVLNKNGVLVLQQLNYDRILKDNERIVGIQKLEQGEIIRFYDFLSDLIRFNVLKIVWKSEKAEHDLFSTLLKPYKKAELISMLKDQGFYHTAVYGSLNRVSFESESRDLVVVAGMHAPDVDM